MSILDQLQKDLVAAMRAKDELRLSVIRGIKAAIQKAADADHRSITVWVELALATYLRQQGLLKK